MSTAASNEIKMTKRMLRERESLINKSFNGVLRRDEREKVEQTFLFPGVKESMLKAIDDIVIGNEIDRREKRAEKKREKAKVSN